MKIATRIAAVAVSAGLIVGVAAAPANAAAPHHKVFATVLRGANETAGGDPDGIGAAVVTVDVAQSKVCYLVVAAKLDTIVAAHIHHAPAGVNGPVVVAFQTPANGFVAACADVAATLAADLAAHPDQYYVNVHSSVFPAGAIRGQLP
jgi:hypothetical protein